MRLASPDAPDSPSDASCGPCHLACGDGEATETTDGTDTAAATQSIEGPPWRLAEARGLEVPQELSLTIQFQDGEVSGQSACNRFTEATRSTGTR